MLLKQGDLRGAYAAWQLAVEIGDPAESAKAQKMLDSLTQLGDLDEVQALAESVDLTDPEIREFGALQAGEHFLEEGELRSALDAFEKAMATGHPCTPRKVP